MKTISVTGLPEKKRKIIDIDLSVFKSLSIKAAENGMSLKSYIEQILAVIGKSDDGILHDTLLYEFVLKNFPEVSEIASDDEVDKMMKHLRS